jgi:uncharacterized protein YchJ
MNSPLTNHAAYLLALASLANKDSKTKQYSVVGQTPRTPKQKRNEPCGCGSGLKAKKCCGEYVK